MSEPIVYISHSKVKEGKLDALRGSYRETVKLIEADKPGTLVHLAFLNEEGSEVTIVHLFPNADAMDLHLQGAGERVKEWSESAKVERVEIYGMPSEAVLERVLGLVGSGVAVSHSPQNVGGYIHLKSD